MLTIKLVEYNEDGSSNFESIREAREVVVVRVGSSDGCGFTLHAHGCLPDGGGRVSASGVATYDRGTVYVMNETGSTVGKYVLS